MDLGKVPYRLEEGKSASEDAGPRRGWFVLLPNETFPVKTSFKTLREARDQRTISASGGSGSLQITQQINK